MSETFDITNPKRAIHVGVVLMGGITELLDVAPVDLFSSLSRHINDFPDIIVSPEEKAQALDIEFHWVNETGAPARLTSGLRVQVTDSFATCPKLDIVIMGAHDSRYKPNERELEFVRQSYEDCTAFITICGGSLPAMQAGIMAGQVATAPRPILDTLRVSMPDIDWVDERWHRHGKMWTSGTLLSGLDAMRAFGEQVFHGREDGTLMKQILDVGHWPKRDVNYADE